MSGAVEDASPFLQPRKHALPFWKMSLLSPSFTRRGASPFYLVMLNIFLPRFKIIQQPRGFDLSLQPAQSDDSGIYFCLVNGAEEPTSALRLAVQDVPSTPGKPLIMRFASSSVELSWFPPLHQHHSPIVHYKIQILQVNQWLKVKIAGCYFQGEVADWSEHRVLTTKTADSAYTVAELHPFTVTFNHQNY